LWDIAANLFERGEAGWCFAFSAHSLRYRLIEWLHLMKIQFRKQFEAAQTDRAETKAISPSPITN
jgi:hypothetical protein